MSEIEVFAQVGTSSQSGSEPIDSARRDRQTSPRAGRAARWAARNPGLLLSLAIVAIVVLWVFLPGLFTSFDPIKGIPADNLQAPSAEHWFGTDKLGRDLYSRVVHGTALSLQTASLAVGIAFVLGSVLGLVAGFVGGTVDDVIMRVVDVMLAIPGILLALTIIAALGAGSLNVAIAVGIGSTAGFARLMRAEVLTVRQSLFVEAAAGLGSRWWSILLLHVLPNSLAPVIALAILEFGATILAVSALSFLGYGALPPAPEWGSLVAEGRDFLATAWWLTTIPGLVIIALVLAVNRISRAIDHRSR